MIKPLDPLQVSAVSTLYLKIWDEKLNLQEGNAGIWFHAVTSHLQIEGYDITPKEIRQIEEAIIRRGLGREYLTSLLVGKDELTDEEKLLALVLATAEERLEGIKKLLKIDSSIEQLLPRWMKQLKSE